MFCGIDVGTQGVRAVVVDDAGALHGEGTAPIPTGTRSGTTHTQEPSTWWDALVAGVREALANAESVVGRPVVVEAVALDATSGTVLVQRRDGSAAGPALMYDDGRATEQAGRAQAAGADLWRELGYRIQPSWALPKIMWLLENGLVSAAERIVHQSDHLAGRLAGAPVATDTSNSLKSGVDLRDASWPLEIHRTLGIDTSVLPDLVTPGVALGEVCRNAAEATGLAVGTPIRAGMTDGCAAQIAAGALDPGHWSSALGTTLVIKGSTADIVRDPGGAVYCHRHPDGGWLPGGASSTGAGAITAAFPNASPGHLMQLTARAAELIPIESLTYPLVGRGERFPFVDARAAGFDPGRWPSDAAHFGALCQGIAFVERLAYDVLATLGADVSGAVSLTGGAARNGWWNQLRTDVLGRRTIVPASSQAAFGMAVLAAAEPGQLASTANRMVGIDHELVPNLERGDRLMVGYRALVGELADRGWLDADVATGVLAPAGGGS